MEVYTRHEGFPLWIFGVSAAGLVVTESARACSYLLSKQVQETCQFWLLTLWLLTVPSPSI